MSGGAHSSKESESKCDEGDTECSVCLQTLLYPVCLPCDHTFCFLCIKGAVNSNGLCPVCRRQVSIDYFQNPDILVPPEYKNEMSSGEYQWYYEGRRGWWQYDTRTTEEIEAYYAAGRPGAEILLVGELYVIDFQLMIQYRRNDPRKKRRIKRDLSTASSKGIAGLLVAKDPEAGQSTAKQMADKQGSPEDSNVEMLHKSLSDLSLATNMGISHSNYAEEVTRLKF